MHKIVNGSTLLSNGLAGTLGCHEVVMCMKRIGFCTLAELKLTKSRSFYTLEIPYQLRQQAQMPTISAVAEARLFLPSLLTATCPAIKAGGWQQ
jgi:hypothetical protein